MTRFAFVALALGLISIPARAVPKSIVVEGVADIRGDAVAAAHDAAIRNAQRAALEQTAGVYVQSLLTEDAFSTVRGDKEKFGQEVTTKFVSQSEGVLRPYHVVKEGREGSLYKVSLEIDLDDTLTKDLAGLARSMARARYPKLMLVIKEEYTDKAGKVVEVEEPAFLAMLEDALLSHGFALVSRGQIEKIRKSERAAFADLLGEDESAAARVAMAYQADYLVNGVARVAYVSSNDLGQGELHGTVELTLRAVNTSTAIVVASFKPPPASSFPAYSEQELRIGAVQKAAPPVVQNLITRLADSWQSESRTGIRYTLRIVDMKSQKKQGNAFIQLLEKLPDVTKVKQVSSVGGRLEVEAYYPASRDVSVFTRAIMDAAAHNKTLSSLDLGFATGRDVNFTVSK